MSSPSVVHTLARYKPYSSHAGMCSAPYDRHVNFERAMGTHNEPTALYPSTTKLSNRRGRCGDIGWNAQGMEHMCVATRPQNPPGTAPEPNSPARLARSQFAKKVNQHTTKPGATGPEPQSTIGERRYYRGGPASLTHSGKHIQVRRSNAPRVAKPPPAALERQSGLMPPNPPPPQQCDIRVHNEFLALSGNTWGPTPGSKR